MVKIERLVILFVMTGLLFAGCGKETAEDVNGVGDRTGAVTGTIGTVSDTTESTETMPHEHSYVYTANADDTHDISCSDETCSFADTEACTPDETFVCTECGWIQEHDCVYEHYECQFCGSAYPWEQDIKYFDETVYYAQKELNIYKYPDMESEVIGTLSVDEEVYCVGSITVGKEFFWVSKDGGCIPNNYNFNANRWDLREVKTSQVIVTYMTLSGDTWSALKPYGVYDSYDAALLDLCGTSWSHIKANWTYNDYKSQGLPFMNSYAEGASGKTVTTRNQTDPYSYSVADGTIAYYFE